MTNNTKKLENYLDLINGPPRFSGKVRQLKHPEIRTCKKCGQKYTIGIPYEHCNPRTRDLCDDCIYPGWPTV
jgi:hypothetical protein